MNQDTFIFLFFLSNFTCYLICVNIIQIPVITPRTRTVKRRSVKAGKVKVIIIYYLLVKIITDEIAIPIIKIIKSISMTAGIVKVIISL